MSFAVKKLSNESGIDTTHTLYSFFYLIKKFDTDTILRDMLYSLAIQVFSLEDNEYYFIRMTNLDSLQFDLSKGTWQFSLCVWKPTNKNIIASLEAKLNLIERRILK